MGQLRGFFSGLITGAALAAAGILLLPSLRRYGRPLALAGLKSLMEGAEEVKSLAARLREDLEDLVAEAEYERARRRLDREIASADRATQVETAPGPAESPGAGGEASS